MYMYLQMQLFHLLMVGTVYIGYEYFLYFSPIRKILDYEGIAYLNRRNSVDS